MGNTEYVLSIPSWFPSRVDLFNGDFNERMVIAFSKRKLYVVIYVVGDKNIKKNEIVKIKKTEYLIIYGYFNKSENKLFSKPVNIFRYLSLYFKLISEYISDHGKPLFIHNFVFFPAGFISWYFARKEKLKNILTENYTIFYQTMPNNLHNDFFLYKFLKTKLLKSFDLIMPVAHALKAEMKKFAPNVNYKILPNVVDSSVFNYMKIFGERGDKETFSFIHISTMGYQKNPQLLLAAFEKFLLNGKKAKLNLIGPVNNVVLSIIKKSKYLSENINVLGEKSHDDVANCIKKADCLVLSSRFENLPCVILEALCCGVPIISTDVGGVNEVINSTNGLIIESENENQLIAAFIKMFDNYSDYDKAIISENAINKFSYESVCKEFYDSLSYNLVL